jgi:hypothetical protein
LLPESQRSVLQTNMKHAGLETCDSSVRLLQKAPMDFYVRRKSPESPYIT